MAISKSPVPKCLLTSLEFVKIYSLVGSPGVETEFVEYILGNAAVLKELNLKFNFWAAEQRFQFVKQVHTFPKCSSACQVFVHPF